MSNKRGLGKGLSALIPMDEKSGEDVVEISVSEIYANKDQPRKTFDEEKLNELTLSIKQHGVLQPVILRKKSNGYEIVAGERRWRAAIKAGLKKIPALIRDISDTAAMEIGLIENLQREDLNPLEEASAYQRLMNEFGMTQEELSKRVGKSRSKIANSVRLLNLESEIKELIQSEKITAGHARALLAIPDKNERIRVARKLEEENLSVRQVEKIAKEKFLQDKPSKKAPKEINPVFVNISEKLQRIFGTKVRISGSEKKGKIQIEFYSEDELERILDIMAR